MQIQLVNLAAGLAVQLTLESLFRVRCSLKWPNDLLWKGRKLCGILSETASETDRVHYAVTGIGLNVNMDREDFDDLLRGTATSLRIETGIAQDRLDVISRLFGFIEKWYRVFVQTGFAGMRDAWLAHADILGRPIRVVDRDASQDGVVTGIDADGAILMRQENGSVQRVIAGDVHLLGR
jgi:BirA family biotin operon repressor/biotin-[acetyl-CoA-carboxylase] ligase